MPVPFYTFQCFFYAWAKLFYARATVKKPPVKRMLYVHKAGARKLLISKELPISKNTDGVLRLRQAPYFSMGKLSSDHFEAATKQRIKSELARDF